MSEIQPEIIRLAEAIAERVALKAVDKVLMNPLSPKRYLSPKDAAQYLGLSVDVLQLWRSQDYGPPFHRIHRAIRYDKQALDAWMRTRVSAVDGILVSGPINNCHEESRRNEQ